ncbi:MAG: thiosulfate oxidation carrier protein SoxY [Pseudomonadota bacterium]
MDGLDKGTRPGAGMILGRRALLRRAGRAAAGVATLGAVGAVGATVMLRPLPALAAAPDQVAVALARLIGDRVPQAGRVTLTVPALAENGNAVPLTVAVESPMVADDHVRAVHILSDGNPEAHVASFGLTPAAGRAEVATRMRLAKTQTVLAVAEMSDGSVWMAQAAVEVTVGGCAG